MKEIENPIIHNDEFNVNNVREPKAVGKCEFSKELIHDTDEYIRLESGEMFLDEQNLIYWMIDNGIIERFNY